MDELLNLIGQAEGASKPFEQWVSEARAAKLRPELIQNLKRRGLVHTTFDTNGVTVIVRGARPAPPSA